MSIPDGEPSQLEVAAIRGAVLLDRIAVAGLFSTDGASVGGPVVGLTLCGVRRATSERSEVLYLVDEVGTAAIIAELYGVAERIGSGFAARFWSSLDEQLGALP